MKQIITIVLALLMASMAVSCGVNAHNSLAEVPAKTLEVDIPDTELVIYKDDHTRTRKNADAIFYAWADRIMLRKALKSKQLVAISPKKDEVVVTYNYTPFDGEMQRVTFHVFNYTQTYRKKPRYRYIEVPRDEYLNINE